MGDDSSKAWLFPEDEISSISSSPTPHPPFSVYSSYPLLSGLYSRLFAGAPSILLPELARIDIVPTEAELSLT